MITSQIFGLVLTACSINATGNVECEEHILDVAYRESVCYAKLEREIPNLSAQPMNTRCSQLSCNLLELESLKCEVIEDMEY